MMKTDGSRILIIEDDLDLLSVLKDFFQSHFDHVITACDGISAYLSIPEGDPDIILTDIRMPGMDGLQLVTRLRAEGLNIPVLMSSGNADKGDVLKALRLGVIDFVEKPYVLSDLYSSIYRVIEICSRERDLKALIAQHGEQSSVVLRQQRMIGLYKALNAHRKSA